MDDLSRSEAGDAQDDGKPASHPRTDAPSDSAPTPPTPLPTSAELFESLHRALPPLRAFRPR